jgi:hypothetical protein
LSLALTLLPGLVSAQEVHRVVGGETLWTLAQRYYNDPYRWPVIYEANRGVVEDAHWIYPGEELVIPNVAATAVVQVAVEPAPGQPAPPPAAAPLPTVEPERTVFYNRASTDAFGLLEALDQQRAAVPRDVHYSAPWLGPAVGEPPHLGKVAEFSGADDENVARQMALPFDRLELEFTGAAPPRGSQLLSFRVARTIKGTGTVLIPTGVLAVSDPVPGGAVALVVDVFHRLQVGDYVMPLPVFTLQAGVRPALVNAGPDAAILAFAGAHPLQDVRDFAFLDQGSDGGVKVGDEYILVWDEGTGSPPVEEGRLQVVSVHPDHSTAHIVELRNPVFETGVRVRLDRRMP